VFRFLRCGASLDNILQLNELTKAKVFVKIKKTFISGAYECDYYDHYHIASSSCHLLSCVAADGADNMVVEVWVTPTAYLHIPGQYL
jgi:hypothetical protein